MDKMRVGDNFHAGFSDFFSEILKKMREISQMFEKV